MGFKPVTSGLVTIMTVNLLLEKIMMLTKRFQTLALMGAMLMATAMVACDPEDSAEACDPETQDACVCTVDGTEDACDPEQDDNCSCSLVEDENDDPDMGGDDPDDDMGGDDPDMDEEPEAYRFLIIEDLTQGARAPYPGVDLDAVTLTKADGGKFYATSVDDFLIVEGVENDASNTDAIKGEPDDGCMADNTKFVALGGEGGYITVSFTTQDEDVTLEEGDTVTIHEIGDASCPGQYDDDPYKASISIAVMKADGNFLELGNGDGEASLMLPALP